MKRLLATVGFCVLTQVAHAAPSINIGTVYDYLEGDKSTYLKRVFNGGDSTAFVKVNILEIFYDADGTSREVRLDPGSARTENSVLMIGDLRCTPDSLANATFKTGTAG